MGLSCRRFFVSNDDVLYRISNTKFERMMRGPDSERLAIFAGQRVRTAELVVELFDRKPYAVCRATYAILQFNDDSTVNVARHDQQQMARFNAMLAPVFGNDKPANNVLDGTDRFVAHGGSWSPSDSLRSKLEKAALGRLDCPTI